MVALRGLAVAVVSIFGATAASAATLNVVGGQLLGASGVDVGGTLYNVEFLDGTCIALFAGCDEASDFVFQTAADASAASQALLDQVFVDGISGSFDSSPDLTAGCGFATSCEVATPYAPNPPGNVDLKFAINAAPPGADGVGTATLSSAYDTASGDGGTYARWSIVPEPSTALLLCAGLSLLSAHRRSPAPR